MTGRRPSLLVLGHVTRDLFGAETRLGGAASYAARAAALLGMETALVSVAPAGAPELEALRETPSLEVALAASQVMTTFSLDYTGGERRLLLLERARPLRLSDVPAEWRRPDVVYVGPVAGECDAELVACFGAAYVIAGCQGWLRDPEARGPVRELELPPLREPPPNLKVACFSRSDHSNAARIAERLTARGVVVAVTEGRDGARVTWGEHAVRIAPVPAREVDPTGAGDVFSLVFGLSLWAGHSPVEAGQRAALAAARVVEGPGLGRLELAREELALTRARVDTSMQPAMPEIDLSPVARTIRGAPAVPFRRAVAVGVRIDGRLVTSELLYGASPPRSSQQPPRIAGRARFPIYSISKTLSALCVLRLAESGRLSIEDPVARWITALPLPRSITLELVLRHQSGLPEYGDQPAYHEAVSRDPAAPWSEDQFLELARRKGFAFEPGTGFRYSNLGYLLVKKVIEAASGKSYRDAVAELVCRPLELEDTFVAESILNLSTCVPGYSREVGSEDWVDVRHVYHPGWCAPGVAVSTVEDTTRIYDVLLSGKFLRPASLAQMLDVVRIPGKHPSGADPGYGLGIGAGSDAGGTYGHGGGGPGYRVECACSPRSRVGRLSVAVFCNASGDLDALALSAAVREIVLASSTG